MRSVGKRRSRGSALLGACLAFAALAGAAAPAQAAPPFSPPEGLGVGMVLGGQTELTQSVGGAGSTLDKAGSMGFWAQMNALRAPWDPERTFRLTVWGSLGGGTAGFAGSIGSEGAYGFRWAELLAQAPHNSIYAVQESVDGAEPIAWQRDVWHALVVRLGYAMRLSHNDRIDSSLVEVPRVEIGYQILGAFGVEARAHAGLVLAGQLGEEGATRSLRTSLGWGGQLTLTGRSGAIDAGLERVEAGGGDDLGPVNAADARICVFTSRMPGFGAGVCGSGRVEQGHIRRADSEIVNAGSIYAGLLIGMGLH